MTYFDKIDTDSLRTVLSFYGIELVEVGKHLSIPYSIWETSEAGRRKNKLYVLGDTPIHSILHETGHFVCMSKKQRCSDTIDAKGSFEEENATCYLQILLSDHVDGFNRKLHLINMDEWGYAFRLGSAAKWCCQDAEDAKSWLQSRQIIDRNECVTWKLRA